MAGTTAPFVDLPAARFEGAQAAHEGHSRLSNPYIARCPGNANRTHKRSLSGWCYLCGESPSRAKARERRRAAWDQGWAANADELRQRRAA